jgi:hypothetical protein
VSRPEYGQPLTVNEFEELSHAIDKVITDSQDLSKEVSGDRLPAGKLREAMRIASAGQKAFVKLNRARETSPAVLTRIAAWRAETAPVRDGVDRALEQGEQSEIAAIIERTRTEDERDVRENDPSAVMKTAVAEEQARRRLSTLRPLEEKGGTGRASWFSTIIIVNVACALVIAAAVLWRRRRRTEGDHE